MSVKTFQEFDRLYTNFKAREHELPQNVKVKLLFIASKIHQRPLKQFELSGLSQQQIKELKSLDSHSLAVVFNTLVRTLLVEKKSQQKQCKIKYPGFLQFWKSARFVTTDKNLLVQCEKACTQYDLRLLNVASCRKSKRSFQLYFKNQLLFLVKFATPQIFKQTCTLLQQKIDRCRNPQSKQINFQPKMRMNETSPEQISFDDENRFMDNESKLHQKSAECELFIDDKPEGYRIVEEQTNLLVSAKEGEAKLYISLLLKTNSPLEKIVGYFIQQKEWNSIVLDQEIKEISENNLQIFRQFKNDSKFWIERSTLTKIRVSCTKNSANLLEQSFQNQQYESKNLCLIRTMTKFSRCSGGVKIMIDTEFNGKGSCQIKDSTYLAIKIFEDLKYFQNNLKIFQLKKGKLRVNIHCSIPNKQTQEMQKKLQQLKLTERDSNKFLTLYDEEQNQKKESEEDFPAFLKLQKQKDANDMPNTNDSLDMPLTRILQKQTNKLLAMRKIQPVSPQIMPSGDYLNLIINNECQKYYLNNRFPQQPLLKFDSYTPQYCLSQMLRRGGQYRISQNKQLIFIDEELLQGQKDTLKFVIRQIGANILSGKSVLNVSLPVDIFESRSLLERSAASFGSGPELLIPVADATPLEQMKKVITFIVTIPTLEILMQKPFNPILGQTFQAYIRGIPIYYEQISHHPPISSYYMECPEFTIYGNLVAFADVSINSAVGGNQGIMHIKMRNGTHFQCYFPPCQISGLIFGERKFRAYGKGYILEKRNNLFAEISVEKAKKGLYQKGDEKLYPGDIIGGIFRVDNEFMEKISSQTTLRKFSGLTKKQVYDKLADIRGVWFQEIRINGEVMNSNIKIYPLEYPQIVLPSDSNFRLDILYHKVHNLQESQRMKQVLQVKQRGDRKLRQKSAKLAKKKN